MSYGSNENKPLTENNYFTAGIAQNVTIHCEFKSPKKDESGDKAIIINIKGVAGQTQKVVEFSQEEPDKMVNQITRLRRWVKEVTGEDNLGSVFNSFQELAEKFISLVNDKNTLLEIKLVYKTGTKFLEMPKYDGCVRAMSNPVRLQLSASESAKCVIQLAAPSSVDDLGEASSTDDNLPF